jgi:tellurite resistance protein TehA-like permease
MNVQPFAFALGVGASVLLLLAVILPGKLLRRHGATLLGVAAAVIAVSLSLYAFGDDRYTSDGRSHWETHDSGHLSYVGALSLACVVAVTAVCIRRRPQALRALAAGAVITLPPVWWISVIVLVSS